MGSARPLRYRGREKRLRPASVESAWRSRDLGRVAADVLFAAGARVLTTVFAARVEEWVATRGPHVGGWGTQGVFPDLTTFRSRRFLKKDMYVL
jgi:hypothetical protein